MRHSLLLIVSRIHCFLSLGIILITTTTITIVARQRFHLLAIATATDSFPTSPIIHHNNTSSTLSLRNQDVSLRRLEVPSPNPEETRHMLDFAVIGFPKCGTTFLLRNVLGDSSQFYMGAQRSNGNYQEMHQLANGQVKEFISHFQNHVHQTTKEGYAIRNGYKAPCELIHDESLKSLYTYFPTVKFIVTMRHPILWFQSNYNFKMRLEKYAMDSSIHPNSRIGECHEGCKRRNTCVDHKPGFGCTDLSNYHIFLSRLGWTPMNTTEERTLLDHRIDTQYQFTQSKMFLMEIGQFDARNQTRADTFISDLETYLDVQHGALQRLKPRKLKKATSDASLDEKIAARMIHICDDEYRDVRKTLLEQGQKASRWIIQYFLPSPHVVVSDQNHFVHLLETWKTDPCDSMDSSSQS